MIWDKDRWQELASSLKSNRLRTLLTAFGVFWGIFMLIIMVGSGKGLENGVTQGFGDFATNSVFIWAQRTTIPYKGMPKGRNYNFNNEDITALKKEIRGIRYLAPRLRAGGRFGASNVVRGKNTGGFSISGDYPDINKIDPVSITAGRFVNEMDVLKKRKVAVIGKRVVEALFTPDEDPLGEYVRIQGVYFQVVGVFESKRSGERADHDNESLFIPFTTMQVTYNYGDVVGFFAITGQDHISVSKIQDRAVALLKRRHHVAPDDDQAVGFFNVEKEFKQMKGLFNGIAGLIWVVGIGTLLAGIIGVSNIMLVIVKERTKEIGIQRAIGASPFKIMSQIILEAVTLTAMSGYLGLVLGVGLVELINQLIEKGGGDSNAFRHPEVDFNVAILALAILVVAGMLAGYFPARRAIRVKPIDALRYE